MIFQDQLENGKMACHTMLTLILPVDEVESLKSALEYGKNKLTRLILDKSCSLKPRKLALACHITF